MDDKYRSLLRLAASQGGFFSASQAATLGISRTQHSRLVASGEWEREEYGFYRMADLPDADPVTGEHHFVLLWSRGRDGKTQAAFAYETAMALYGMSDLQPPKIHLSVPKGFRRTAVPKNVRLHPEERDDARDVWEWNGLRVVRPLRTVLDMIREERVSPEHIERGFIDGFRKGLITESEIEDCRDITRRERVLLSKWKNEERT